MISPYKIRYWADCTPSGYGYAARGYLQALAACGVRRFDIRVIPLVGEIPAAAEAPKDDWLYQTHLVDHAKRPNPAPPAANIVHAHPPLLGKRWAAGWYNIAVTTWERDRLPEGEFPSAELRKETVQAVLKHYDEIWVPTEAVAELFRPIGTLVRIVPHALTHQALERRPRATHPKISQRLHPALTGAAEEPVRFYYIGSWDARKNVETLLASYFATGWNAGTPVELVLHCTPSNASHQAREAHGMAAEAAFEAARDCLRDPTDAPSVRLLTTKRTYQWVLELHRSCHVFATASRGEGFCLPALEALAFGNPLIGGAQVLKHFPLEATYAVHSPLRTCPATPEVFGSELGQRWWEPDPDSLTAAFKAAFADMQSGTGWSALRATATRDLYSPDAVAGAIAPALERAKEVLGRTGW